MEINTEHISEAVQKLDSARFVSYLEHYVKASSAMDSVWGKSEQVFKKIQKTHHDVYSAVMNESTEILSQSANLRLHMADFRFRMNGQFSAIPEINENTHIYFRKIKKQQMEVVSYISDEVETVRDMITRSEKMRKLIRRHIGFFEKTSYLMNVLRERIVQRPTTLLRIEGRDEKIQELNMTFREVTTCENIYETELRQGAKSDETQRLFVPYQMLIQSLNSEISQRKQNILSGIRELNQGWELLQKLMTKGYSRRMKRKLDVLLDKHHHRTCEFQKHVKLCRADYFQSL